MSVGKTKKLVGFLILIFLAGLVVNKIVENNKPWNIARFNSQKLSWRNCGSNLECSSFKVPIDYDNLKSGVFTLQILRHPATNQKARLGVIVVNPGGPGGSAIDYAAGADEIVSKEITSNFDIVGFDQRGVGQSQPIRCLSDKAEDKFIDAEENLPSVAEQFAKECAKVAGSKLGHISTLESAKDMEILRNALAEPRLNFLGKSYGTYLGAIYIANFTSKVGRFVLDGAVDPNISLRDQNFAQALSFENSLDQYLKKNSEFSKSQIQQFIQKAKLDPLKDELGRKLTQPLLITAIAASLYDSSLGWENLKTGLHEAIVNGNPKLLFGLADSYNNRDQSGHYFNNENDIGIAMSCLDWNSRREFKDIAADAKNFIKASPTFGRYIAFAELPCSYWPVKPRQPKLPFKNIISPKFLIIGVTNDPATPYRWAQNLAMEFSQANLLTLAGEGHTGHNRGNKCIDSKVDAFFMQGKLPEPGTVCGKVGN